MQQHYGNYDVPDCCYDDMIEHVKLKSEQMRLKTFETWPKSSPIQPEELARDGFYYLKTGDHVKCIFCNLMLKSWEHGDHVREEHNKYNPNCPFVLGQNCRNVPINRPRLGSSTGSNNAPMFPEFSKPVAREESFRNVRIAQDIEELVEAGFFFVGPEDYVKCFHCGVTICHWQRTDDPMAEHRHWSPSCEFARSHTRTNENFEVTPVVRRALDMGYDRDLVRNAIQRRHRSGGEFKDLNVLVESLEQLRMEQENVYGTHPEPTSERTFNIQPSSDTASSASYLENENRELKEKMLCKICMERDVAVTFMPCGHLVTCETCGKRVKRCPMCRKSIRGFVKTYLS